jgi:sortase A
MERVLWTTGATALAFSGFYWGNGAYQQAQGERELAQMFSESSPRRPSLQPGSLVGRIRVPRLDMASVIFEGTEEAQLRKGVGHWSGSVLPLDPDNAAGNVVLAAHRDTFFRKLQQIQVGDRVILETVDGEALYSVSETRVVSPTAVEVLQPTGGPVLTLITCYPFQFVGPAPDRFIVRAHLESPKGTRNKDGG